MKKRIICFALCLIMLVCAGCSGKEVDNESSSSSAAPSSSAVSETKPTAGTETGTGAPIADGMYQADFNTDSSMFHVNEANDGKGVLTVAEDGSGTTPLRATATTSSCEASFWARRRSW